MNGNTYSSPVYNILTGIGREGAKTHTRSFTPCFKKNNDGMTEENALKNLVIEKLKRNQSSQHHVTVTRNIDTFHPLENMMKPYQ